MSDFDDLLSWINVIIAILALILTIVLAVNGPKINDFLKKKKLRKIVRSGYNSVFYFNLFWISPIIYFLINILFILIISFVSKPNAPDFFTVLIFTFLYVVICWIIYMVIDEKFNFNIDLIKSMDTGGWFNKYYKHFNLKSKILKKYSFSFAFIFAIVEILLFLKNAEYVDIILSASIIAYFISLIFYILFVSLDQDRAVVKTEIKITIDYRPLQNYFLNIKIKDDKVFNIDDDSLKIYSKEGATLYTISKDRLYNISSKYSVEEKFKRDI